MTLTEAATSSNAYATIPIGIAAISLIATVVYALCCWIKPFTHCHRCEGKGTTPHKTGDWLRYRHRPPAPRAARGDRQCPRCRGTGLRLRIGRRVANALIRRYRQAH
ncbi:hypothetical protein M1L60_19730 [Actinoplanes sp. TRM 88003]|uniref:Uncharacterized protein n=1 Tax=Paractinoplanes aksuensis TaxID=2939490 RepID=A0ABT1DS45_9ACTN|nr:hypothetical protein [Actinoplanes aksuensis]MCO8272830.1 hypothetical protein [Actinoplanes aksuensis]